MSMVLVPPESEPIFEFERKDSCRFCGLQPRKLPSQYCSAHCYAEGRLRELRQQDVENWLDGTSAHSTIRGLQ